MNRVDRLLQQWRIRKVLPWIGDRARVLDVGCFDASLFEALGPRLATGVGLDPLLDHTIEGERYRLTRNRFPDDPVEGAPFDAITMLAVLEHAPANDVARWASACWSLLADNGVVVATIPSPAVDKVLPVLSALRIVDGMSLEEHHGFEPADARTAFEHAGFRMIHHARFQLGFNNLFVFQKTSASRTNGR